MIRAAWLVPVLASALPAAQARADSACHVVDAAFTPADFLQIVAWVEQPDGTYVDTIYITRKTGTYGLGNRPGRFDFNSGPAPDTGHDDMWPYGRRTTVFPVWAHRHGLTFPEVDFQQIQGFDHVCCGDENNLSHPANASSSEKSPPFCRPMTPADPIWDSGTCASLPMTDKGIFHPTRTSLYPPRSDLGREVPADSADVDMFRALNPFDAVSQATPIGGSCTQINWPIPPTLAAGDYVLWIEASKGFDMNASYNPTVFPAPIGIPWGDYGKPYRGQPSVVYRVPFTVGDAPSAAAAQSYIGYGDPTGADGVVRAPDTTITTDTPGSGASRLMMIAGSLDRVRVHARATTDTVAPGAPTRLGVVATTGGSATLSFIAPGDDGATGSVSAYEVRYRAFSEMTADMFADATEAKPIVTPGTTGECGIEGGFPAAGTTQTFELGGLLPDTEYWVGVRAFDKCHNAGPITITKLTTAPRTFAEVDACFIATAAYGSPMANDVTRLRDFRDRVLRSTALGELAVEMYYTFGPGVAGVIGESDLLRAATRAVLEPVVARAHVRTNDVR